MDADKLMEQLKKMGDRLDDNKETRHKVYEQLNSILLQSTMLGEKHELRITAVEETVTRAIQPLMNLASDFRDIKTRLVGDDTLKSVGLLQSHDELIKRVDLVQALSMRNGEGIVAMRRERVVVMAMISSIGAVVLFLKTTQILHWLSN